MKMKVWNWGTRNWDESDWRDAIDELHAIGWQSIDVDWRAVEIEHRIEVKKKVVGRVNEDFEMKWELSWVGIELGHDENVQEGEFGVVVEERKINLTGGASDEKMK